VKVISFSLFGTDPTYTAGALANAQLAREVYPGWTCRFYVGSSIKVDVISGLEAAGAQVVDRSDWPQDWSALLWRYDTLTDPDVEAHLFRDCDSRLSPREAAAVQEWLDSGADFHIIRDHPEHYMPMMAGMWAATAAGAKLVADTIPTGENEHRFVDQVWLRDAVYPVARDRALVHDEFHRFPGEAPQSIPAHRAPLAGGGAEFIGQGYNADGGLRNPTDAHRLAGEHEWRLFEEGTIPECTTREWYLGRERAPHLEQPGQRDRILTSAALVARVAFEHRLNTVVDLGAGDGGLLSLLGPNLTAWGYDLCPDNVEGAKERGVDVRYGDVIDGEVTWADIAVCTEMLEHLVDPHAFVRRIAANAKALICSSPADERPAAHYEFHTWAWDEVGYRRLVEQAGFKVRSQQRVHMFQVLLAVRP
jgi:predicted RNA methylase